MGLLIPVIFAVSSKVRPRFVRISFLANVYIQHSRNMVYWKQYNKVLILPEYQSKGYGSRLMDLLEARIFENYPKVHVDASFPAESMYLKRGYKITSYEKIETGNGDFLCYPTMEKTGK